LGTAGEGLAHLLHLQVGRGEEKDHKSTSKFDVPMQGGMRTGAVAGGSLTEIRKGAEKRNGTIYGDLCRTSVRVGESAKRLEMGI